MSDELYAELLEEGFDTDRAYRITRTVAVTCPECRLEWNASHPDDVVDEAEATAYEDRVAAPLRDQP